MKIKCTKYLPAFLCLIIIILLGAPYYTNGYWHDDALNSQIKAMLQKNGGGLWEFSTRVVHHWLVNEGRFVFGFYYLYPLFYFIDELQLLRALNFVAVITNICLYGYILRLYGASMRILMPWAIILIGLFQIHGNGLDPVGGFAFHYPILGLQLFISIFFYSKWILGRGLKNKYLSASMLFWSISMLCYEINIIFIPIAILLLALEKKIEKKPRCLGFAIIITAACIYLIISLLVRKYYGAGGYSGTQLGEIQKILPAYYRQTTGALPGITYAAFLNSGYSLTTLLKQASINLNCWIVLALSGLIFYINKPTRLERSELTTGGLALSLCMLFLPGLLPSISLRYQNEIALGCPTMPIYYQVFGMAFLILYIPTYLSNKLTAKLLFSSSISVYLALNLAMNTHMATAIDCSWREPRDAFISQVNDGLLGGLNDGDVIIRGEGVPHYINGDLIFGTNHKRVLMQGDDTAWYPQKQLSNPRPQTYKLSREAHGNRPFRLSRVQGNNS